MQKNALIDLVERLASEGGITDSLGMGDFNNLMLQNNFDLTEFDVDSDNLVLAEYTRK